MPGQSARSGQSCGEAWEGSDTVRPLSCTLRPGNETDIYYKQCYNGTVTLL
jgi:hypothetical protein